MAFPGDSDGKESACSAGDQGSVPGLGRSPGGGNATCSSILAGKIPWRGAWRATVHGVSKSQTRLNTHTHKGEQLLRKWSLVELRTTVE